MFFVTHSLLAMSMVLDSVEIIIFCFEALMIISKFRLYNFQLRPSALMMNTALVESGFPIKC